MLNTPPQDAYVAPANEGDGRFNTLRIAPAYVLRLDDVDHRTVVNTYNLGIMSGLAYTGEQDVAAFFAKCGSTTNNPRARSEITAADSTGTSHHIILREVPASQAYRPAVPIDFTVPGELAHLLEIDTQGFMVACDDHAIIAFRGTQESTDFGTDGIFPTEPVEPKDPSRGLVHEGFKGAWSPIRGVMARFAREHGLEPGRPVFVCGHSLGAALALLTACYLRELFPELRVHLYNFGQPRVGNTDYASRYAGKFPYFRVVDTWDIIPMLPIFNRAPDGWVDAAVPILGPAVVLSEDVWLGKEEAYAHFGAATRCGASHEMVDEPSRIENVRFDINSLKTTLALLHSPWFGHHFMGPSYIHNHLGPEVQAAMTGAPITVAPLTASRPNDTWSQELALWQGLFLDAL